MSDTWAIGQGWSAWIAPLGLGLFGFLVGKLAEGVLHRMSKRMLGDNTWLPVDVLSRIFKGNVSGLLTLGGLYLATFSMPLSPDAISHIRQALFIGSMLIAIRFSLKLALESIWQYASQGKNRLPNTSIIENLVRIFIVVLGILVILQTLGVSVLPIVTALGVGGLAISLALQDTLANLFAGLHMILARQIKVGDTIQLEGGQSGVVKDIGWRTTTIQQLNGNLTILPNSKMASSIIVNYIGPHPDLNVTLTLPIPLDSDLERVEAVALDVAKTIGLELYLKKHPKRQNETFEPHVRFASYGDAWVNMNVTLPFKAVMDAGEVRHRLLKALHQRLHAEEIRFAIPQHVVHLDSSRLDAPGLSISKN